MGGIYKRPSAIGTVGNYGSGDRGWARGALLVRENFPVNFTFCLTLVNKTYIMKQVHKRAKQAKACDAKL